MMLVYQEHAAQLDGDVVLPVTTTMGHREGMVVSLISFSPYRMTDAYELPPSPEYIASL